MAKIKIELPYVNSYVYRNRHDQSERHYFRVRGQKAIPLRGEKGSPEFMEDCWAARVALKSNGRAKPTGAELTTHGSSST